MTLFICWILGFLGPLFLLFTILFSRRRYKSIVRFEPPSLVKGRVIFFILLSLLIACAVFFDRFIENSKVNNVLSVIVGLIGVLSFVSGIWILSDAVGKAFKELEASMKKKDE